MPTPRIPDGRRPKERPELRAATVRSRCPPGQAQAQAQGHNTPAQRGHPTPPTRRTTSQICVSALGVGDARPRDTRTTARPETRLLRARPRRRRSPAAPESFGWPAAQAAPWPPGRAGAEQRAWEHETCAASAGPWQQRGVRRTPKSSVRPARSHAPRRTAQHTAALRSATAATVPLARSPGTVHPTPHTKRAGTPPGYFWWDVRVSAILPDTILPLHTNNCWVWFWFCHPRI